MKRGKRRKEKEAEPFKCTHLSDSKIRPKGTRSNRLLRMSQSSSSLDLSSNIVRGGTGTMLLTIHTYKLNQKMVLTSSTQKMTMKIAPRCMGW